MEITKKPLQRYKPANSMTKQFEFINTNNNLTSSLKEMLEFINDHLVENVPAISLLFKAKIILTELLTNAVKHSFSRCALISISIADNNISLSKTDYGMPLSLIAYANMGEPRIPITNDILHTLYAIPEGDNTIRFACEESTMDDLVAIERIVEHFGLIIITKASDRFVYKYSEDSKANVFTANLSY
jgi:hypothetical protein